MRSVAFSTDANANFEPIFVITEIVHVHINTALIKQQNNVNAKSPHFNGDTTS